MTKSKAKEWNPIDCEEYFYLIDTGDVWKGSYYGSEEERRSLRFGNYFRTRKLAQIAAKKIRKVLKEVKHG